MNFPSQPFWRSRRKRLIVLGALLGAYLLTMAPAVQQRFRLAFTLPATVRSDHPAIVPIAAAIRRQWSDPLDQVRAVEVVTLRLIEYQNDELTWGRRDFAPTLDEMLAKRRQQGWVYPRDNCQGRAVFAAHLLASLNIPWKIRASFMLGHAWVTARVKDQDYDILLPNPDSDIRSPLRRALTALLEPTFHRLGGSLALNPVAHSDLRLMGFAQPSFPNRLCFRPLPTDFPSGPRVIIAAPFAAIPYGAALR